MMLAPRCLLALLVAPALAPAQTQPLLSASSLTRVSPHVYAIVGWPNVGIIVGDRATLVVDTGLGPANGATVLRQARKLGQGSKLYLTTTHFHPEHASGDAAFPASAILVRPAVQQKEMQDHGAEFLTMFSGRNAQFKELLADVHLRPPDVLFDRELKLDLGGVTARLMWLGGGHTRGDELAFVEPDGALLTGDIVENKLVPGMPNADSSVTGWLSILDQIAPLNPRYIVPDHGALGDGSLIAKERAFLSELQRRALDLKRQGTGVDEAGKLVTEALKQNYPDYENLAPVANVVRHVYTEAAPAAK